jgi:serine protease inhibitor
MKKAFFFSLLIALLAMQCDKNDTKIDPVPDPTEGVLELAEMNHALGGELFQKEQQAQPGENVLLSPLSVQTALLMAHNGAEGSTQAQILDAMGGTTYTAADLNQAYRDMAQLLQQSGHPEVTIANGYFYDDNRIKVEDDFLSTLSESYDASAQILDFREATASVDAINTWVEQQTNGKIKDLLQQITDDDLAFLINALYFKADWSTGFAEEATFPGPFTTADGSEVEVEYVNADRRFTTAVHDGLQLVDLPFRDSTFSLSLVQPEEAEEGWPATFTTERWRSMYEHVIYGRAMVFFPKLKLSYKNDLIASLKQLGMTDAFIPQLADFSAMGQPLTGPTIYISQITHNAVLEIDEKGAEGAAATSIGFSTTSAPPMFRFDEPFVLVLRHIPTNTMLFVGYVADPGQS